MAKVARSRHRETEKRVFRGRAYYSDTGVSISGDNGVINIENTIVDDWIRAKADPLVYPFDLETFVQVGGQLNKNGSGNQSVFIDFYPTVYDIHANFPHLTSLDGNRTDTQVAVEAAARTNPSRAYVDVPVDILELGDIAQLLRDTGNSFLKRGAHANLSYQFGIAPLVDDLFKLWNFLGALQQRMKEIDRLKSKRGLRRTITIGRYSKRSSDSKIVQSQGVNYVGTYSIITRQKVRAHCRWYAAPSFQKLSRRSQEYKVKRALHGLTADFSTLWQATPWTWLIDYCTDIGNYFKANRNIIGANLQDNKVWVIRHTQTEYVLQRFSQSDYTFNKCVIKRETKVRRSAVVAPSAWLPFLSANQLGILLSLSILRTRGLR